MEDAVSDETRKVQLLRSHLQASYPQASEIDDATLRRFLRARSLNVEKACKFLLQHLKWRHTFVPLGCIQEAEIANELKKEKIFLQGVDKEGRPIGVILARRHQSSDRDLEEFKRFVVYGFDKAVSSLPGHEEKFVLIADLKGYSYKNMDVKGYLAILDILQDHYPERLGKLFMVHVPSLFSIAWKIVYPLIDPKVKDKVSPAQFTVSSRHFPTFVQDYCAKNIRERESVSHKGKCLKLPVMGQIHKLFYLARLEGPNKSKCSLLQIVFVEDKQLKETLLKDIDVTELPVDFGGQRTLIPIQNVTVNAKLQ